MSRQPLPLLESLLEDSGFWRDIERVRRAGRVRRNRFRIVIKPDLDWYSPSTRDGTDPVLVEHLIDLLHDRGLSCVVVGDGRCAHDGWLHNRDPLIVPDLAGYRFVTDKGRSYDIVDLRDELTKAAPSGSDRCMPLSRAWMDAHYRINFAKNKTHEEHVYALCAHNLAGLAGDGHRHGSPVEDCLEILRRAPPHFNIIDAYVSCHGGAGHRAPRPMHTHAFIASPKALLADWAGAAKMGVDPCSSPINDRLLRYIGLPDRYAIEGDLAPYPLWRNVHPLIAHSARLRSRWAGVGNIARAWFQSVDRERFPFKDFYNDRVNSFVSPLMERLDEDPRSFFAVVLLNYVVAAIGSAVLSQYTMFSKNKLQRRAAPLSINLNGFGPEDYETIPGYLDRYEPLVASMPPSRTGLRWRHVEESVLFSCSHVFPIPYKSFVDAVDITRSIQYMNDYIGGSTVAVLADSRNRTIHQAERNLYLQQPNWMVLFGGDLIDVEKLELVEYKRDRQSIHWRTVASPNDSAIHDDGRVSFLRTDSGQTMVTIFARQHFTLPFFFKLFDVNFMPGIRDSIIESAYDAFFAGTVSNLEAEYEGRNYGVGRDAASEHFVDGTRARNLAHHLSTAAAAVAELLRHRKDMVDFGQWLYHMNDVRPSRDEREEADEHGFRHFGPAPDGSRHAAAGTDPQATLSGLAALMRDSPDFFAGLMDAVRNDLDRVARSDGDGSAR